MTRVKQWEAYWRYVMSVVDLAVVPTGRGSSQAEEPGSSLDVADRADTAQGNWASASAEAASAIHPAQAAQDTQQHTTTTAGGRDGGAAPGGADGGADRHTLRLPPHHGGAAPQAGREDAAHQPS